MEDRGAEGDAVDSGDRNVSLIFLAIVVLGTFAWVTLKAGPSPAATLTNRILFFGILVSASVLAWRALRAERPLPIAVVASTAGLFFLAASALFAAHLGAVLSLPLRSASVPYDFRLYSLLLLGGVGLVAGVQGLRSWPGLARAGKTAWDRSKRACLILLAVNVPLIPLQDFALALSICGAGTLAGLLLARSHFQVA